MPSTVSEAKAFRAPSAKSRAATMLVPGRRMANSSPPMRPATMMLRHCRAQEAREGDDHRVAGRMAEIVVDRLEMIEVGDHQRHRHAEPVRIPQRRFRTGLETASVEQAGQHVGLRPRIGVREHVAHQDDQQRQRHRDCEDRAHRLREQRIFGRQIFVRAIAGSAEAPEQKRLRQELQRARPEQHHEHVVERSCVPSPGRPCRPRSPA